MGTWIVLGVLVALGLYVVYLYNTLVRQRQMVREGWSVARDGAAIGAVESLSTRCPLALPTWEQTTTLAPASVSSRSVGSDSLIRVSSEMVTGPSPLANGVFRSERTRHVTPLRSIREARELTLSLFGMEAFAIVRTRCRARIAPTARSMAMGGSATARVRPRTRYPDTR